MSKKPTVRTPINVNNTAEVVTSLVMLYSGKTINFDAVYAFVRFYINSTQSPTLEGLVAAIREGDYVGREYLSNKVFKEDLFN